MTLYSYVPLFGPLSARFSNKKIIFFFVFFVFPPVHLLFHVFFCLFIWIWLILLFFLAQWIQYFRMRRSHKYKAISAFFPFFLLHLRWRYLRLSNIFCFFFLFPQQINNIRRERFVFVFFVLFSCARRTVGLCCYENHKILNRIVINGLGQNCAARWKNKNMERGEKERKKNQRKLEKYFPKENKICKLNVEAIKYKHHAAFFGNFSTSK